MGLVVGVEVVEDDAGQATFEAAQGLSAGGAGITPFGVVGPAEAVEADLGDGDAVQGSIELTMLAHRPSGHI
jgi:hypothetical protein